MEKKDFNNLFINDYFFNLENEEYIKEVIKLKGGNLYKEGRKEGKEKTRIH